jgi:hypothetical protein
MGSYFRQVIRSLISLYIFQKCKGISFIVVNSEFMACFYKNLGMKPRSEIRTDTIKLSCVLFIPSLVI